MKNMNYSAFPNILHGDKWRLTLSNIPTLTDVGDMKYFDNYLKSLSIPSYQMGGEIISHGPGGFDIRHPLGGMRKNRDLGHLNITYKVSEDMYNYLIMFSWMMQLKYGNIDPRHEDYFRKYSINKATLSMLDNQKRVVTELSFTQLLPITLGELSLNFGSTDELSFNMEFSYEEIFYKINDPTTGGKQIEEPVNLTECGTSGTTNQPTITWDDVN